MNAETDKAALMRAILVAPDEDDPRMVFADWLDDHGEHDWATMIRPYSVEPTMDEQGKRYEVCFRWRTWAPEAARWADELFAEVDVEGWPAREYGHFTMQAGYRFNPDDGIEDQIDRHEAGFGEYDQVDHPHWRINVDCGFIDSVETTAAAWFDHGPRICSEHPVRAVRFTNTEQIGERLGATAAWTDPEGGATVLARVPRDWPYDPERREDAPGSVPLFRYPSREAWESDLSRSALAWARAEAAEAAERAVRETAARAARVGEAGTFDNDVF